MKYVGDLIAEVRRDTRNEDVPTDETEIGIVTNDFLRYINFAQEKCQAVAISAKSTKFQTEKEISLVAGQIQYSIPDRVYLDEHILNVELSSSGLARDYTEIREESLSKRDDTPGYPTFYIRRGSSILLCPAYNASGGKARVTYDRAVDSLDLRRGVITARTISSGQLTSLTLSTSSDDVDALSSAQYLCVNDAFGNVTMYNIPMSNYDSSTGVVNISGGAFTFQSGEVADVGTYVTVGQYTTTHCKLNSLCERYLAQYAEYKIFRRDSSSDANAAKEDMRETLKEIMQSYAEAPRDECEISIDNEELILSIW